MIAPHRAVSAGAKTFLTLMLGAVLSAASLAVWPGCASVPPGSPPKLTVAAANDFDRGFAVLCTAMVGYASAYVPPELDALVCPGLEAEFDAEIAKVTVADGGTVAAAIVGDAGAPAARRVLVRSTAPATRGAVLGSIRVVAK